MILFHTHTFNFALNTKLATKFLEKKQLLGLVVVERAKYILFVHIKWMTFRIFFKTPNVLLGELHSSEHRKNIKVVTQVESVNKRRKRNRFHFEFS